MVRERFRRHIDKLCAQRHTYKKQLREITVLAPKPSALSAAAGEIIDETSTA